MPKQETAKIKKDAAKNDPNSWEVNPKIPPIWVDNLHVAMRDDNICLLRFFSSLPEGDFEQIKVITSSLKLKHFIDAFCQALNYYPEKNDEENQPE